MLGFRGYWTLNAEGSLPSLACRSEVENPPLLCVLRANRWALWRRVYEEDGERERERDMYVYIYMHIERYVYIHINIHIYLHMYIHTHTYIYIYIYGTPPHVPTPFF